MADQTYPDPQLGATYTKLHNGQWGLRVPGTATAGSTVTVTKKSGESRTETIGKVLWTGNGISLCTIESSGTSARGGRRGQSRGRRECPECGEYVEPGTQCWETGAMH